MFPAVSLQTDSKVVSVPGLCSGVLSKHLGHCLLIQCPIVVKRHHDHGHSYKGKCLIGACLQRFGPFRHGGKHGSMQADVVLERKLRVLHLDQQGVRVSHSA